jgi:hypothetical protein
MGLLDDAIREHLDLKRARGADPAEIERMEREALGPVRREPAIGSALYEMPDEHARHEYERGFDDEPITEFEELQELGYHDSTAPHPHTHHEHAHEQHDHAAEHLDFDHEHLEPEGLFEPAAEPEPPKRRFLRRSRHESAPEPLAGDLSAGAPLHEVHDDEVIEHTEHTGSATPPHLQFEHPPKRPRFSTEPLSPADDPEDEPSASGSTNDAPAPVRAQPEASEPEPAQPAAPPVDPRETQETTEFDVERHLTEAQHADQDEDVLEETPEFLQDTPEHDRLWFEQRPPRDFDFDG